MRSIYHNGVSCAQMSELHNQYILVPENKVEMAMSLQREHLKLLVKLSLFQRKSTNVTVNNSYCNNFDDSTE